MIVVCAEVKQYASANYVGGRRSFLQIFMGWLMGIEPTTTGITIRDSTTELQPPSENESVQPGNSGATYQLLACPTGIEPVTPSLEGWCSIRLSYGHHSNRILPQISTNWSGWRDLNSRHPGPKPGALPGCATPRKKADSCKLTSAQRRCYTGTKGA